MKHLLLTATLATFAFAGPMMADGDAAKGEKTFKKCKACHAIINGDEIIVKGGKTGPNLFGVIGRDVASTDFKYGNSIIAAGETGAVWDEEMLEEYVEDPKAFLIELTGDSGAKSKMTFKLKSGGDDVAAYLASLNPSE